MHMTRCLWLALPVAVAGVLLGGCDDDSSPSGKAPQAVTRPAEATGVDRAALAAAEAVAKRREKAITLEPLTALGEAKPVTKSDGKTYQEYANGLAILRQTAGKGDAPKVGQEVKMNYVLRLPSGQELERSPGEPLKFTLGGKEVISGWSYAASLMTPGEKATVWLPPALAYGAAGQPPKIGPNQDLIFELELVQVSGEGFTAEEIQQARAATQAAATQITEKLKQTVDPVGPSPIAPTTTTRPDR